MTDPYPTGLVDREPVSHVIDAHKLAADGIVELFQIILNDGTNLFLKSDNAVTWQGKTWEGVAIKLSGFSNSADPTSASRPQLVVGNPLGVFSSFVTAGKVNKAQILRLRVLLSDITADNNVYAQHSWQIFRVVSMTRVQITFELRTQLDGPNGLTPGRLFLPPEFPTVSL